MSKLEALTRLVVQLLDLFVFFFILIKGLLFIWEGGGGYILFWGSALVITAVFWAKLDKDAMVSALKTAISRALK
jgi:hypothetical protein